MPPEFQAFGKVLIITGLSLALLGAIFVLAGRIPFLGRLPGDLVIQRDGFSFLLPVTSMIVLSVLLTVLMNLVGRFLNRP